MKDIEEVGINISYEDPICVKWAWVKDSQTFWVRKEGNFDKWINDFRMTTDDKTIGQMNRELLHKRLDEFLDNKEWE